MEEKMERIEIPFTYTYDQFTVFFHGDHVFIGERDVPVGQCAQFASTDCPFRMNGAGSSVEAV